MFRLNEQKVAIMDVTKKSFHVANLSWFFLALVLIGIDQWTKALAQAYLYLHAPLKVLSFFNLTLAYNEGAAFSFLNQAGGWQHWIFSGIAIVVSTVISAWLLRLPKRGQLRLGFALSFILGGALGNLIDRFRYGHVIDFLDFHIGAHHWPVFNIADSAIFTGAMLLVIDMFLNPKQ